jgi:hypothetical protein
MERTTLVSEVQCSGRCVLRDYILMCLVIDGWADGWTDDLSCELNMLYVRGSQPVYREALNRRMVI